MIQTDIDHITLNEKNNFSLLSSEPQPITWTNSSFTPVHSINRPRILVSNDVNDSTFDSDTHNLSSTHDNNTEDDNIDWEFVTKQLETKLRTSGDIIQTQSDESYSSRLPPKIPNKYRFRPITSQGITAIQSTPSTTVSNNNEHISIHSESSIEKPTNQETQTTNKIETNLPTFSPRLEHTSTLHELFNELYACQQKQVFLLEKIQELINQSEPISSSIPPSSNFFLPLNSFNNNNSKHTPTLQDAFQQRKSSFIEHSKERVKQIYRHNNKYHHRIIPTIKQTNNTYLQEKRQYENDRLCAMIIKHQNRQNAKIYGNSIKNHLCHNSCV